MAAPRSEPSDTLILIAAAMVLTFTAHRFLYSDDQPQLAHIKFKDGVVNTNSRRSLPQPLEQRPLTTSRHGWAEILWRTYRRIDEDRLLATAGGVVFFGLLALFPAITALVSCYGLFADPVTIGANLQSLALMLPQGTFQIVQDQIARVLAKGGSELGWTFLFGLALAIWSANTGVKAIIDALNVVYEQRETRNFFRLNLLSLSLTVGAIGSLLLIVGAVVVFPLALDRMGLAPQSQLIAGLARWPLLLLMLVVSLAIVYRFGPSPSPARNQWLGIGTFAAALLWIAGSSSLSVYLSNFGNYDATYGSLGAAIGLMMWMWMSAIIVLCGAELNSEIRRQA